MQLLFGQQAVGLQFDDAEFLELAEQLAIDGSVDVPVIARAVQFERKRMQCNDLFVQCKTQCRGVECDIRLQAFQVERGDQVNGCLADGLSVLRQLQPRVQFKRLRIAMYIDFTLRIQWQVKRRVAQVIDVKSGLPCQ